MKVKKKRKLTEEGKKMIAFWRSMAKCKPIEPSHFKKATIENKLEGDE